MSVKPSCDLQHRHGNNPARCPPSPAQIPPSSPAPVPASSPDPWAHGAMGPAPRELLGCCGPSFGAVSLGPTPRAVRQCLVELEGTRIKAESSPRKGAAPAMGCDVSALDAGSKSGESEKKAVRSCRRCWEKCERCCSHS